VGVSNATVSKLRRADYPGAVFFNVILKIANFFNMPLESFAPDNFGGKTYRHALLLIKDLTLGLPLAVISSGSPKR
jgi:transcriptional regulator with XRE-family HTH domain